MQNWQTPLVTLKANRNDIVEGTLDLECDNVAHEGVPGLKELGIEPRAIGAVLPDYLWRFRPSGQYSEIKASAKNLKA